MVSCFLPFCCCCFLLLLLLVAVFVVVVVFFLFLFGFVLFFKVPYDSYKAHRAENSPHMFVHLG